jgi:hypothetical protein
MEQTYAIKSMVGISLIFAVVFANASLLTMVNAQSMEPKDIFKVIVSLSGITSSTRDILILVNVKDQTKSELFNAENPQIEGTNKVNYTITFPGSAVDEGDKYTVCILSVKNFELQCDDANNSPLNRPEFVDINLSAGDPDKEAKGKDDKKA